METLRISIVSEVLIIFSLFVSVGSIVISTLDKPKEV